MDKWANKLGSTRRADYIEYFSVAQQKAPAKEKDCTRRRA
jgi:hypothetical protein